MLLLYLFYVTDFITITIESSAPVQTVDSHDGVVIQWAPIVTSITKSRYNSRSNDVSLSSICDPSNNTIMIIKIVRRTNGVTIFFSS